MPPSAISLVRWQHLALTDQSAVASLTVSAAQIEFAGTIERAIASCEAAPQDEVAGLAIQVEGRWVGFLVLKRRTAAPAWASASAATISAMRIDQRCQGQGVGSRALLEVSNWVAANWPESLSLTLSVDEENEAGIRAYRRAGFEDHGVRVQGRIGWVRYMSKPCHVQPCLAP